MWGLPQKPVNIPLYSCASWHFEVIVEAVARRRSMKKVFLKTLQNSQENICDGFLVSF